MPVLKAPTVVASKSVGDWIDTSAVTNSVVAVKGTEYDVQLHYGDVSRIYAGGTSHNGVTLVVKAAAVRVVNTNKNNDISYEVFA